MTRQESPGGGRIAWLDLCKGLAMALVLVGHSMRDEMRSASPALDFIYRSVYIFHMTWFFWMAGYTYRLARDRGRPPVQTAMRRLKKQLWPWAAYTLLIYALFSLAVRLPGVGGTLKSAGYAPMPIGDYILSALRADNPWAYHLWFLYVLMLLTLIVSLADGAFGGRRLNVVCGALAILGLAGVAARGELALGDWWRLYDYITLYLPVFCLGTLMANMRPSWPALWAWGGAGFAYIMIRAAFFSGFSGNSLSVDSASGRFALYLLADLLLPGLMLLLGRLFETGILPRTGLAKRALSFLGRESMLIYLLHQPFCCAFLGLVLFTRLRLPALPVMAVCLAASVAVPWAAAWARDRIRARRIQNTKG